MHKVVLFGATSAMAQETGRLLAARGAELFLVGRDERKLQAVMNDLEVRGATRVDAMVADLDDTTRFPAILDEAARILGRLDLVLVAQGVLGSQPDAEARGAVGGKLLHTNFVAPALLLQESANRLAAQQSGTLVAISSVAGDRGRQSNYFYGAAKGGLSTFLSGLRNRAYRDGVHVLTVKPGFVDTPMTAHLPKNALYAPPDRVARAILRAVEQKRNVIYVPGFWRAVMLVIRAIPESIFKRLKL
jgi:decaprenylphospho-beta-D-erythro-pentofuranosid-2-ulose 2-reductase